MKKINLLIAGAVAAALGGILTVSATGPASINLGSASNFTVLAKSGISTTGATSITGNIGVSPAAASFITGFGLIASSDTTFSTTPIVVGKVYAASYTSPTPSTLTTAVSDMETAYTDGSGRSNSTATELGAGNIGGLTITPGLYKWGTGVVVPSNVTLSGGANDVWIFQIAGTLTVSSGVQVILTGGAQANNVYWVVAGQTTLGTTADFSGNIIDQTAVVLNTGARLNGRALAQTAVTLDANSVTLPSGSSVAASVPVVVTSPTVTPVAVTVSGTSNAGVFSSSYVAPVAVAPVAPVATTNISGLSGMNTNTIGMTSMSSSLSPQIRSIVMNLMRGSRGSDVATLQEFLISQNKGQASQALMRVGATAYFGNLTRSALAEFQANVGISPALGNFGSVTRAYISSH